jgi:hypothetical protein
MQGTWKIEGSHRKAITPKEFQPYQPLRMVMQEAGNDRYLALDQPAVTLGKVAHSMQGLLEETALLCQTHEQ